MSMAPHHESQSISCNIVCNKNSKNCYLKLVAKNIYCRKSYLLECLLQKTIVCSLKVKQHVF